MDNDTIVAIASPPGTGAISLIRVSGPGAFACCDKVIESSRKIAEGENRKARLVRVLDEDQQIVDEALLTPFKGPKSFTGEDVVEFACHGGVLITRKVLSCLLSAGARSAAPGEFSQRAFEHGKLDLTQAEAIMDLISAQTDLALRAAHEQLQGKLGDQSEQLRESMIEVVAHVEAFIDFPEEDIDPATGEALTGKIDNIMAGIDKMLSTAEQGRILREGVRTVLCGEPNVGKSSLLNALLGYDRAIVSDVEGTTRDTVEEVVNLQGIPLRLIDTAGVRESTDSVEKQGIERSQKQIELADLIIEVVDGSKPGEALLNKGELEGRHHILVINKSDIGLDPCWEHSEGVRISCLDEKSVTELSSQIIELLSMSDVLTGGHVVAINARHQACLKKAKEALERSKKGFVNFEGAEFVSLDLREALESVGEIAGRVDTEEIFDEIFGTFCIGK